MEMMKKMSYLLLTLVSKIFNREIAISFTNFHCLFAQNYSGYAFSYIEIRIFHILESSMNSSAAYFIRRTVSGQCVIKFLMYNKICNNTNGVVDIRIHGISNIFV